MTRLILAAKCPHCGWKPALRISKVERSGKMDTADDQEVLSYKCRNCDEMYPITAKAYKGAA